MEKSTRLGQKLGVVHAENNDIPERSRNGLRNSASDWMVLQSEGLEAVSSTTYPSLSSMSPSEIQHLIDDHVYCIVDPWIGSLPFAVFNGIRARAMYPRCFAMNPRALTLLIV